MSSLERLQNEKKTIKQLPDGFFACPLPKKENGVLSKHLDYFNWICGIPGKTNTIWEGSTLVLYLYFPSNYPSSPPLCMFIPAVPHPNVYLDGQICLSLIKDWRPTSTIKDVLMGI